MTNAASAVVRKVHLYRNGTERTLKALVEITPSAANVLSRIKLTLPDKSTNFSGIGDAIALTDGFTVDDQTSEIIKLFNVNCVPLATSLDVVVQIQSRDTQSHFVALSIDYTSG
jgi:hypothetical protein